MQDHLANVLLAKRLAKFEFKFNLFEFNFAFCLFLFVLCSVLAAKFWVNERFSYTCSMTKFVGKISL